MALRLLQAALWRKRGSVALAVLAVAIGSSVAGALLHVSRDVSRQLTRELRALGPNLLVLPSETGPGAFLDEAAARDRLRAAGLPGAALLFVQARLGDTPVTLVGADLPALRALHPSWRIGEGDTAALLGARLADRLGARATPRLQARYDGPGGPRWLDHPAGARLESGGPDDDAWWVPLAAAQRLAGLPGRISLMQSRVDDPAQGEAVVASFETGGAVRARLLRPLSSTEARLLDRTRRLMGMVTVGVLLAAGLCAFGTLTDLALERRREIALLKALGATAADVVRQFGAESFVIGLAGGLLGWWMGVVAAQIIGREVFHAAIALHWEVLPIVVLLSVGIALLAGIGPIRLALGVDPAPVLRGE